MDKYFLKFFSALDSYISWVANLSAPRCKCKKKKKK